MDGQFTEDSGVADFNEQVWRVLRERGHKRLNELEMENQRLKKVVADRHRAVVALREQFGRRLRATGVSGRRPAEEHPASSRPCPERRGTRPGGRSSRDFSNPQPLTGAGAVPSPSPARPDGPSTTSGTTGSGRLEGLRMPYREKKRPLLGIGISGRHGVPIGPTVPRVATALALLPDLRRRLSPRRSGQTRIRAGRSRPHGERHSGLRGR